MLHEDVKFVLAALHGYGIDGVCAGGAARDALLGVQPKDYDIVLFGPGGEDKAHRVVQVIQDLGHFADLMYGTGSNATATDCEFVVKTNIDGIDIDIIQNVVPTTNADDACGQFDYSICCAYFNEYGYPQKSKHWSDTVRPVHDTATAHRLLYLLEKFGTVFNFGIIIELLGIEWLNSELAAENLTAGRHQIYTRYLTTIQFPNEPEDE